MKRQSDLYLKDIVQAIDRIKTYVGSKNFEQFVKENLVVDAVLRNLEIIGEAATQLQQEVKDQHKEVPWREIMNFRIVIAHHYWKINQQRIWDIIESKLAPLHQQIEEILK